MGLRRVRLMRRWGWGCLVVVVAGLAALGWSSLPVIPDCDGLTMGPGDRCIVLEGGIGGDEGVFTYEESVEGEHRSQAFARVVGWILVVGGVMAFVVGAVAKRWEAARLRDGSRGPEAIAREVEAGRLGDHVCTVALRGDRTLHLHRGGVVVERRQAVESTVAWRDVDEVQVERSAAGGDEWVHTCVLVSGGRRVRLRASPGDRSTLSAVSTLVAAAHSADSQE
jgi:hypothetical protein